MEFSAKITKDLNTLNCFSLQSSIADVQLGSKYASDLEGAVNVECK